MRERPGRRTGSPSFRSDSIGVLPVTRQRDGSYRLHRLISTDTSQGRAPRAPRRIEGRQASCHTPRLRAHRILRRGCGALRSPSREWEPASDHPGSDSGLGRDDRSGRQAVLCRFPVAAFSLVETEHRTGAVEAGGVSVEVSHCCMAPGARHESNLSARLCGLVALCDPAAHGDQSDALGK
jgi:hypothetical protein